MKNLEEFVKNSSGETKKVLEELVHTLANSIQQKNMLLKKVDIMAHEIRLLKKRLFGSSSEKINATEWPAQEDLPLFNEFELVAQEAPTELPTPPTTDVQPAAGKKSPGRKPLPAHLPRRVVEHDLPQDGKQCACGADLECIGTQVSEELEYVPAKLEVIEHRCKKYICACCVKAKETDPAIRVTSETAAKPAQLIPKSFASAGLLAHIAVAKFCDHLPLYRQEQMFQRLDIDLSRQTMSGWMLQVGQAIVPLVNLLQDAILDYDVAFADETTVQVLKEPGRRPQTKSYMWCFIGGSPQQRVIVYQYHPSRAGEIAQQFFDGYQGALHCDGYAGYAPLLESQVIGINCFAHVRRKFFEALPDGKEKGVAGDVVVMIRALYAVEEKLTAHHADVNTIYQTREEHAKPLLERLKAYLDEKVITTLPKSPTGKAIAYTLKRWPYLLNYLKDGRYEIDNNRTERAIKPFVTGRKNWLFSNSADGAHSSARLFSLIETAKANHLNPVTYLTHIFKELPGCKNAADFEALLPWNLRDKEFFKIST
jgi:transposase